MTGPQTPATDPEAPYGRMRDGRARTRPKRPSGTPRSRRGGGGAGKTGAGKPAAPPRSSTPRAPSATPTGSKLRAERTEAVAGVLQLVTSPLAFVPDPTGALALDVATVGLHGRRLAGAAAVTAESVPQMAAAIDRLATIGPYAALVQAMTPFVAQLAVNHGAPIEVLRRFGAVSRERLQATLIADAREQAEADAAALAAEAEAFDQLRAEAAAGPAPADDVDDQGDDVDQVDQVDRPDPLAAVG